MQRIVWTVLIIPLVCCMKEDINSTSVLNLAKTGKDFRHNISKNDIFTCPEMCNCSSIAEIQSIKSIFCKEAKLKVFPTYLLQQADKIALELNNFDFLNHSENNRFPYAVTYLSLKDNEIIDIDRLFFREFIKLKSLILSYNDISALDWTTELYNTSLIELDLSNNKITKLTKNSFGYLPDLKRLDLSHNSISSIGPSSFYAIPVLQKLVLTCNNLVVESIYNDSFAGLYHLTELSLADNKLLAKLPQFKAIGLDKSKLEYLDLHGLSPLFRVIPAQAFEGLNNLTTLNLSYCVGLENLNLGWLDGGPHTSLETLDLSNNNLRVIRDYYFVATGIIQYCSENDAPTSDDSIFVKKQKFIDADKRKELYQSLPALSWLSLSDNVRLTSFETNSFVYLPKLQYLFLQRCNLSKLNLAQDDVQFHTDAIRETYKLLQGIWIFGNPWYCDCHLRNIIDISDSRIEPKNKFGLTTTCEISQNTSEEDVSALFIDKMEYFYRGRCHAVASVQPATCFDFQRDELWLSRVPRSYLRCPNEPIVLFIAIILGPLSLVAAVLLILLCGFCKVFVSRLHRSYATMYNPKYYYQELRNMKFSKHINNTEVRPYGSARKRATPTHQQHAVLHCLSPTVEKTTNRTHYQTNMVLGGFNASSHSNHSQTPLLRPFPIFPNKRTSSVPPVKRLQKKYPCSSHSTSETAYDHLPVELNTYCSKVDRSLDSKELIQATRFSSLKMNTCGSNSSVTLKSGPTENDASSSAKTDFKSKTLSPFSYTGTNFLPVVNKRHSNPSIHQTIQNINSEIDLSQLRISESPTIPYIDDDTNIKSTIESFVYQDPVTKAIMPKNTQTPKIVLDEKPLLNGEKRDANANKVKARELFHKKTPSFQDSETDYYSS